MANYFDSDVPPLTTGKRLVKPATSAVSETWDFLKADAGAPAAPAATSNVENSTPSWEAQNAWKHKRPVAEIVPHAERVANDKFHQRKNEAADVLRQARLQEMNTYNGFNPTTCDEIAGGKNRNSAHKTGVVQGGSVPLGKRVEAYLTEPQPVAGGRVYRPGAETDAQFDRAEFGMEMRNRHERRVQGIAAEGVANRTITARDNFEPR